MFNRKDSAEFCRVVRDVIASSVTLILFSGGVLFAPHWIQIIARFFAG